MSNYVIGIDIGGTNIKMGVVNPRGKVIAKTELATARFARRKNELIEAIIETIQQFIQENKLTKRDIKGIGVGVPGLIDPQKGIVKFLPNIPGWKNVPLKRFIEKKLRIPTFIENDVNLITLGEWKYGAGVGVKNLVCMTLGTGVGGGLVLNDELYRGEGFSAGEVGHMPLNEKGPKCNCGGNACFERYVGNKILLQKAQKMFRTKDITVPKTRRYAREGDRRAFRFWEEAGTHIGNGLVGVINLLNPALIIIGGGVSHSHMYLFTTIRKIIRQRCLTVPAKMVKVVRAKLGNDAGIIGAQVLINEALKK